MHERVLREICEEMLIISFCDHHNAKRVKMKRTNVFTDRQMNHYEIELRDFQCKWKHRFTNEQHLQRSFSQWVRALLNRMKSIYL